MRVLPGRRPNILQAIRAYRVEDLTAAAESAGQHFLYANLTEAQTDGSLDLWVQTDAPAADRLSNWLPVKAAAPFLLNARLYWPKPAALSGTWGMPGVERFD